MSGPVPARSAVFSAAYSAFFSYHVASILTSGCVDSKRLIASSTKSRLIFSAAQWLHNVSFTCWPNALDANVTTTTASNHLSTRMHASRWAGRPPDGRHCRAGAKIVNNFGASKLKNRPLLGLCVSDFVAVRTRSCGRARRGPLQLNRIEGADQPRSRTQTGCYAIDSRSKRPQAQFFDVDQ